MKNHQKILIVLLRLSLGFLMFYAGVTKLFGDFSAAGFLTNATKGPFVDIFHTLAGSSLVDNLVIWGEILIGLALITGTFIRFACYMGALMMLLFYLAVLLPEHGPIDEHVIYIIAFAILASFGSGRILGIDYYLERFRFIKQNKIFKYLLG